MRDLMTAQDRKKAFKIKDKKQLTEKQQQLKQDGKFIIMGLVSLNRMFLKGARS